MRDSRVDSLFSTPVYYAENRDPSLLGELRAAILQLAESTDTVAKTNVGSWHSTGDLFQRSDRCFKILQRWIVEACGDYLTTLCDATTVEMTMNAWAIVARENDYHEAHCHPGSSLSGTFYVEAPPVANGGELVLIDPRKSAVIHVPRSEVDLPWRTNATRIQVKDGLLVVFPSWLEHCVASFRGPGRRICLAFNVYL